MWILWATLAGIVWASSNLIEKLILDKKAKSIWGTLVLFELCNVTVAIILVAIGWRDLYAFWPTITLAALGNIVGVVFYLFAQQREEISRVVPLWLLNIIIVPLGDAFFLQHVLTAQQYFAILGLLVLGFLLIFNRQHGLTRNITVLGCMLLSAAGYSSMWLVGDTITDQIPPLYFTGAIFLLRSVSILLASVILGWWRRPEIKTVVTWSNLKWAMYTTLASLVGFALYFQSLRESIPSLVEALTLIQYIVIVIAPLLVNAVRPGTYTEQFSVKQLMQKLLIIGGMIICALILIL